MTAAEHAVNYAIRRVVDDPDFRHHMLHTQTLRLMLIAEAERKGARESDVERDLMSAIEKAAEYQPESQLQAMRRLWVFEHVAASRRCPTSRGFRGIRDPLDCGESYRA